MELWFAIHSKCKMIETLQNPEIITTPSNPRALEIGSQILTIKPYAVGHFGILLCVETDII